MEIQIPTLDGLDATRQIHEILGYQQKQIIAMNANDLAKDKVHSPAWRRSMPTIGLCS